MVSANLKFVCRNCGKCCEKVAEDYWLNAELSKEQKERLLEKRNEYHKQNGCEMLIFEGGISRCLVEILYGKKAKPKRCIQQPFGKPEIFCK